MVRFVGEYNDPKNVTFFTQRPPKIWPFLPNERITCDHFLPNRPKKYYLTNAEVQQCLRTNNYCLLPSGIILKFWVKHKPNYKLGMRVTPAKGDERNTSWLIDITTGWYSILEDAQCTSTCVVVVTWQPIHDRPFMRYYAINS